jgi:hypothetical protein
MIQSQPRHIVQETLSWRKPSQKRAGRVAQGEGPEFKPQYRKKQTNKQKPRKTIWLGPIKKLNIKSDSRRDL